MSSNTSTNNNSYHPSQSDRSINSRREGVLVSYTLLISSFIASIVGFAHNILSHGVLVTGGPLTTPLILNLMLIGWEANRRFSN